MHHEPSLTPIRPFEYIYSNLPDKSGFLFHYCRHEYNANIFVISNLNFIFVHKDKRAIKLFAHAKDEAHPFGGLHRLKLIHSIIKKECGIELDQLSYQVVASTSRKIEFEISKYTVIYFKILGNYRRLLPIDKYKKNR
jgi:hypothetical protein